MPLLNQLAIYVISLTLQCITTYIYIYIVNVLLPCYDEPILPSSNIPYNESCSHSNTRTNHFCVATKLDANCAINYQGANEHYNMIGQCGHVTDIAIIDTKQIGATSRTFCSLTISTCLHTRDL